MSVLANSFEGEFEHKLDKKLRVSVPAAWRPASGQSCGLRLLKWENEKVPVLKALTEEAFRAAIESINQSAALNSGQKSRQKGALFTHNQPVTVNEQGKILIPKKFSEQQGFLPEGTLHLLGRGNYFEIVNPQNYATLMEKEKRNSPLSLRLDRLWLAPH